MTTATSPKCTTLAASHIQDRCWKVPLVAMGASFLICMAQSSTGYLYVLFMDEYKINREMASWPESIIMFCQNLGGFLVSLLLTKISIYSVALIAASVACVGLVCAAFAPSITWMSVALGAVYGIGYGSSAVSFSVFTMLYFDKYRATATSLKYVGWAASGLAGPLVLSSLAMNYGLGGTLLLSASITLHAVPLVMFLKSPRPITLNCTQRKPLTSKTRITEGGPQNEGESYRQERDPKAPPLTDKTATSSPLTLFRKPAFYVLLVSYALCDCCLSMHTATTVDYGRDKGATLEDATLAITYNALGQFLGRIVLPFTSDRVANGRCKFTVACFAAAAVWFGALSVVRSFLAFVALNTALGLSEGFVSCIRSVLVNDYLGVDRLPAFFGFLGVALLPLSFSGPSIIGFFRDRLGWYDNFYRVLGAVNLCVAALLFILLCWDNTRVKNFNLPSTNRLSTETPAPEKFSAPKASLMRGSGLPENRNKPLISIQSLYLCVGVGVIVGIGLVVVVGFILVQRRLGF
ncbi:monocarboxylate transporter 13-like [Haemaphysalis longicornis]